MPLQPARPPSLQEAHRRRWEGQKRKEERIRAMDMGDIPEVLPRIERPNALGRKRKYDPRLIPGDPRLGTPLEKLPPPPGEQQNPDLFPVPGGFLEGLPSLVTPVGVEEEPWVARLPILRGTQPGGPISGAP